SVEQLMALADDTDPQVRQKSLAALTQLQESRAVGPALRALERDDSELLGALKCLAEMGGPEQAERVTAAALRSRSTEILQWAARLLLKWGRASELARIQGASGVMLGWRVSTALPKEEAARTVESIRQRSFPVPRDWHA